MNLQKYLGTIYRSIFKPLALKKSVSIWPLLKRIQWAETHFTSIPPTLLRQPPRYAENLLIRTLSADDFTTKNFLEALDYVCRNRGDLFLPPGRIVLTSPLYLPSGVRIVGIPGQTELVFQGCYAAIIIRGDEEYPVIGTSLKGLRIRHINPPSGVNFAVYLSCTDYCVLSEIDVVSPHGIGFLLADHVSRAHLDNCRVFDGMAEGFLVVRSVKDCLFSRCTADACQGNGILFADWHLPAETKQDDFAARFTQEASYVGFSPDHPGPHRNSLEGCVFNGNRKMGICCDGVGRLQVLNCIMSNNECEGITLDNGSWQSQVLNCRIHGNGRRGLQHQRELEEDQVLDDGMLPDGTSKVKLPGVSMDNAAFCQIANCMIEDNFGDGVKLVRSVYGCVVKNNVITNNNRGGSEGHDRHGIFVCTHDSRYRGQFSFPSSYNVVSSNQIIGGHSAGIRLSAGTAGNLITDNLVDRKSTTFIKNHSLWWNRIRDNRFIKAS